jgi:hypothetical protein
MSFIQVEDGAVSEGGNVVNVTTDRDGADSYPDRPVVPPHDTVIVGLRDSMTYLLAVQLYQGHRPQGGVCSRCGHSAPCTPRRNAAGVIEAAGEDPRRYDAAPPSTHHRYADTAPADRLPPWDHPFLTGDLQPTPWGFGDVEVPRWYADVGR